jgi:hypothetical protein
MLHYFWLSEYSIQLTLKIRQKKKEKIAITAEIR